MEDKTRHRRKGDSSTPVKSTAPEPEDDKLKKQKSGSSKTTGVSAGDIKKPRDPIETGWTISTILVVVLSFVTRFWRLAEPHNVVFDEVHFGKFASYYLRREYYFDVHPPLGKLLLAGVGYLAGYDGHFLFDNIGDDYLTNNVPYYAFRSWTASCGAVTVILAFLTLKEIGVSIPGALFGAGLLMFDTAMVTQSRLILLDSMLFMFATQAIFCWVKFFKLRYEAFSFKWWLWLSLTGISLALTMGVKMVGLFAVATVGIATLVDLWRLLDIRRGNPMSLIIRHFAARALCLIFLPTMVYLVFFYIHFEVLVKSGTGDAFMSPAFNAELRGSDVESFSTAIPYYSNITLKHRDLKAYLHSHPDKYPLTYEDGRVSSAGQQVTGYPHKDINNHWRIEPADASMDPSIPAYEWTEEEKERGVRYVRTGDLVRLFHPRTNTRLITHDVASSLMSTHMEMTAVDEQVSTQRYKETLWKIDPLEGKMGEKLYSFRHHIRLVNHVHKVAVHCHKGLLPDWGFGQHEVNGNKNLYESNNNWFVEEVMHPRIVNGTEIGESKKVEKQKIVKKLSFIQKFLELQRLMIQHNAGLTNTHPYSSTPITWPFVLRGISFWENRDGFRQVYLLGNPVAWWLSILGCIMYAAMYVLDRILLRRGLDDFGYAVRRWWDRGIGFLILAWIMHYIPFFLMGRVLFIHHYLPSYVFSAMTSACVFEFIGRVVSEDTAALPPNARIKDWMRRGYGGVGYWSVLAVLGLINFVCFWYMSPISYGTRMPSRESVAALKLLKSWDLQHA
ncbi:hypothetical protein HK098_003965 [Nowakowskiella sp. JEL0407]|nr:hypothetical protein HK098_003965 [Nowakowskiella sp. JEL0407]